MALPPSGPEGCFVAQSNEELLQEVERLRTEIRQLREIVNALFTAVFEDVGEESVVSAMEREEFNLYN
jgi:hypothetical protein